MTKTHIGVIGAGTMGNGIAQVFAQNGFWVDLIDVSEAALYKGLENIAKNLDRMVAKQKIDKAAKAETLGRIAGHTDIGALAERSGLVVEAVSEDIDLKRDLFGKLDALCPTETLLASNTSSISITQLAAATGRPDKVVGMHFMNPVPIMPLVEVVKGFNTTEETMTAVTDLAGRLGKTPVRVNDYPGFVSNRILMPMINEAVEALNTGVAGVGQIDSVMRLGMAHPMGPLQLADFIGLDVCLSILNVLYQGFKNPKYAPCPLLTNMVHAGKLGVKSGEGFYDYSRSRKAETVSSRFLSQKE